MPLRKNSTTDTVTWKNTRTCPTLFEKDSTIDFFPENTLAIKVPPPQTFCSIEIT